MRLSDKKRSELWNSVYKDITDTRVQIIMLLKERKQPWGDVDELLYNLSIKAPEAAVKLITKG